MELGKSFIAMKIEEPVQVIEKLVEEVKDKDENDILGFQIGQDIDKNDKFDQQPHRIDLNPGTSLLETPQSEIDYDAINQYAEEIKKKSISNINTDSVNISNEAAAKFLNQQQNER